MKEFKSWRCECYSLVGACQGIVCSVWIFRKHIQHLKLRYIRKKFKNAAGTGVGGFDSCTDTTYFTKNYLKIILKISQKISRTPHPNP